MSVDVRVALARFTAALERHLEVVSSAAGSANDEAVERAYFQLEDAFMAYDEALESTYGEMLPFEVSGEE